MDFIDSLYNDTPNRNPLIALEKYTVEVPKFVHGVWECVARVPQLCPDGQTVEVYECRLPARFYKLLAFPEGKTKKGFTLSTGSGDEMGKLIAQAALAISEGMLGVGKL